MFLLMNRQIFFVYLVILTIIVMAISFFSIIYFVFDASKHSPNIIVWLEEYVNGPSGTIITRFVLYIFILVILFSINTFLIHYCIEEYKKL